MEAQNAKTVVKPNRKTPKKASKSFPARKIDLKKCFELRYVKGLTQPEIATYFDCSKQSVSSYLQRFEGIVKSSQELDLLRQNEANLVDSVKFELLFDLADKERRQKASLNNVGYVWDKANYHSRLLHGQSTVNVCVASLVLAGERAIEGATMPVPEQPENVR